MITLEFPGIRPQSKRNSQFRNGFAYVEPHYRAWRSLAAGVARSQWLRPDFTMREPIDDAIAVSVTFKTASGVMRGDLDNGFAAMADVLQDSGIIANDKQIKRLSAEIVKSPRSDVGITVTITPL
jgi:Holliday junction resolvase RusA-like endonuclease